MDQYIKDQFIAVKGTFVGPYGTPSGWTLRAVGAGNDEVYMVATEDGRVFIGGQLDVELTQERQAIMKAAVQKSPVHQLGDRLKDLGIKNMGLTLGSNPNVTADQVATEVMRALDQMQAGKYEVIESD